VFDAREQLQPDTLNRFEHWWAVPVQYLLLAFGLANAGVPLEQMGTGTYYVLAALLLGKPIGIVAFAAAARRFGAPLPPEMRMSELLIIGVAASIGFTVALFFATAAFPEGTALAETKMGALLSFVAAPLAIGLSKVVRVRTAEVRE
jgi:NhaA family Na+:H+ antiporter